jgi:hypothetical protein
MPPHQLRLVAALLCARTPGTRDAECEVRNFGTILSGQGDTHA